MRFWVDMPFLHKSSSERPLYVRPPQKGYSDEALGCDLARLKEAWADLGASRDRDAIYTFLAEIFAIVEWWEAEGRTRRWAPRMLGAGGVERTAHVDPFAAVILAAAGKIDRRTLSKWSRALRYAARSKPSGQSLKRFIKSKGGLNACAARYSRRFGRAGNS